MTDNKRNYQDSVTALIQLTKTNLRKLGKRIVEDFQQHAQIDEAVIGDWLRLQNVLNMYKVCHAFFSGSAFYRTDTYHFVNQLLPPTENFTSLTTLLGLAPIEYYNVQQDSPSNRLHICNSYVIQDDNFNPSQTLLELLFSRTSLECSASIQIANYLTLLDFFQLIHGNKKGQAIFDVIFGPKSSDSHNLNRLRIGSMGSLWTGDWYDFTPLYFFMTLGNEDIAISNLKNTPEKYIGSRFYIKGDIDYLEKHPEGIAQGWNVIFIGLDEKSNPLFLAANEYKQRFIFTYHEMLSLLARGFNQFPGDHTNPLVYKFVKERDLEGFKKGNQSAFDISMIKLFITNLPEAMKRLHEFCDNAYVYLIRRQGYDTKSNTIKPAAIHRPLISHTRDDHDTILLNFYKTNFRGDPVKKTCKDDQSLRVLSNSMFFPKNPGQKINDLIAKALDLISYLYTHSSNDEEMEIFCQQSYAALNHYQLKLEQGTLQQVEIEKLIDFVKTLGHLCDGLEPSTVQRISSS